MLTFHFDEMKNEESYFLHLFSLATRFLHGDRKFISKECSV